MHSDARAPAGLTASAHLFHLRSWRDAARSLRRDRRRLPKEPGLRFVRLVFVGSRRREGFTFGFVDPRLQLALCLWEDEAALERFLEHSPIAARWLTGSDRWCEVRMTPFRTHGRYRGEEPLAGLEPGPVPEGPVAVWTFAHIPARGLYFFWHQIRHAAAAVLEDGDLVAGTAGPERLYTGAMTFTIWESLDPAVRFAYRKPPHKQIVKRVNEDGLLTDSMFIRLQPYAARGRWPRSSRFQERFDAFARSLGGPDTPVSPSGRSGVTSAASRAADPKPAASSR
jgi:hypothetical protein